MATIITDRPVYADQGDGGALSTVLGVIVFLVVVALLAVYGLPLLRSAVNRGATTNNATYTVPQKVNVQVPSSMDVNVNKQ